MKRVYVSVINDLVTDQRVHKACLSLQKAGFEVVLVGRRLKTSPPMPERPYRCVRMRLLFEKGPFFYLEFNLRLLLFLLFRRFDLLLANDLDTLLPNYLLSRLRRKGLIYDSHEYFTETPELVNRPFVQGTWKLLERAIVPRLDEMITVNESIARLFSEKYGIKVHVVRNIPPRLPSGEIQSKAAMGLPDGKHLLVMQGSGINIQRGAEELVEAMRFVDKSVLLIIGGGDVLPVLKRMVADYKLEEKVLFFPRMPFHQLMQYTRLADLGFTLDKNTNINYRFSLPNKLFDFIQAGVPVVASRLPEVMKIVDEYQIGTYIDQHDPTHIAAVINRSLADTSEMQRWKNNLSFAAPKLCWENEEKVLLNLYAKYA